MAILRSTDGKFYDVADDQLEDKLIPAEEIKENSTRVESAQPLVQSDPVLEQALFPSLEETDKS